MHEVITADDKKCEYCGRIEELKRDEWETQKRWKMQKSIKTRWL